MKSYTSESGSFSLEHPDHWSSNVDEGTIAFYDDENGVGAFQVTEFTFEDDAEIDLRSHLTDAICEFHDLDREETSASIQLEGSKAWTSFETEDSYWMYWFYFDRGVLLFVTYNSELEDKLVEADDVKGILASIKLNP